MCISIILLSTKPWFFKERITLSSGENVLVGVYSIRWIAIYLRDSDIRSLNNPGQV